MMNVFDLFRSRGRNGPSPAETAKERLQVLIHHERIGGGTDFLPRLREEIVALVTKYVDIDPAKVAVNLDRDAGQSTLAIEIEVPGPGAEKNKAA